MANSELGFLREVELRLLRCTFPENSSAAAAAPPPPPHPRSSLLPLVDSLVAAVERGDYAAALSSDAARAPFAFAESWESRDSAECAARFYAEAERSADAFLLGGAADAWLQVLDADEQSERSEEPDLGAEYKCALLLCLGVAAILAFTQQNVTGPTGEFSPFPIPLKKEGCSSGGGQWDVWARNQLASVCSVQGKFSLLQYIVYAKALFSKIKNLSFEGKNSCSSRSVSWWLFRTVLLQQKILDERASSLYDLVQSLKNEVLLQFGKLEEVSNYWGNMLRDGEGLTIVSVSQLEAGMAEYQYDRVDSSRMHLKHAEEACNLCLSLTGVLGFRTVHQVDAKAQLVLIANTNKQATDDASRIEPCQTQNEAPAFEDKESYISHEEYNSCEVLRTPRLLESEIAGGINGNTTESISNHSLTAIQQAVVLAQCLPLGRSSRDDELSKWEMAPYIESIDAQHQSYPTVKSFCEILRIRWESTRSRTKERALLMMTNLVENIDKAPPVVAQRIQLVYGVYLPTIPALRKDYGELLVSCGLIGEALKIFGDLELWDNLIYCYRLLGKKAAAVDLIKARLSETPNDPRLWCSLGDVTNTDIYYKKALEVSNNKSARALRSLARSAYERQDYKTAKDLWESALALNSLYPDGWFALGAAALKDRDIDKAVDAFSHAVQIDPDNGEAWNNIACLHMVRKKSAAAFIAFKEAVKFRRNSWQVWDNFSHVALDIGNFRQALEAIKMALDMSSNKWVDVALFDRLIRKFEERSSIPALVSFDTYQTNLADPLPGDANESENSECVLDNPREFEHLLDMLGNILKQVVQNDGNEDIWGLYARWHKIKGNLTMCSEALLRQIRSLQGSELWRDIDKFKRFAQAALYLCKVSMEIASSTGNRSELVTAEFRLRSYVKQAVNFSETEEFRKLQSCLNEIKERLDTTAEDA
ncbi:tetratricopeptide repeat protein 27 homolog [Ananas comosus]|uniref:Tetratricopeptide repeat protein 27 homolog n=1 Tax=Ananas comosus TaxID=4615 RepID=A0A6P5ENP0_ANACO|nr:tetratricopeptide repeat protein 27 homolog [Ananas comosus]